ncbi:MAG: hypothetical protein Q9183_006788, partial [Haloplaca sp. 2 TL-2023]
MSSPKKEKFNPKQRLQKTRLFMKKRSHAQVVLNLLSIPVAGQLRMTRSLSTTTKRRPMSEPTLKWRQRKRSLQKARMSTPKRKNRTRPSKPRNWMDEDAEFLDLPDIVEAPAPAPAPGSGDTAYSMDSMFSALQDIENEPQPGLMEPLQPQRAQPLQQEPSASITNDPIDYPATRSNEVDDQHMDDAAVPSQEFQSATQDAHLPPAPATNNQQMYSDMELSHLFKNTNSESDQHTAMELDDADQRMDDAPEPSATHQAPSSVLPHNGHMNENRTVPSFQIPQAENANEDQQMEDVSESGNEQQPPTIRHPQPEHPVDTTAADRIVQERRDQVLREQNANRIMRLVDQTLLANSQSPQH